MSDQIDRLDEELAGALVESREYARRYGPEAVAAFLAALRGKRLVKDDERQPGVQVEVPTSEAWVA